ncbi:MAG TPA: LytTR family DNA-binding domain-containing protein [Paracoccaceae bacterium]|nr:LytTR family DNA-binding domain-containing protein [Paracoccaceae bacterium]
MTADKPRFVKRGGGFANGAVMATSALRRRLTLAVADTRAILGRGRLWATCVLLIALFTLLGPFDTMQRLSPGERAAYWGVVMTGGWLAAAAHVSLAIRLLPNALPETLRATLGGAATAPCMAQGVGWWNEVVFGSAFLSLTDTPMRLALFAAVAAAVTLLSRLVDPAKADPPRLETETAGASPERSRETPAKAARATDAPPEAAILRRLPAAKRGGLLRLSMQDHYVEIVTETGSDLALLRLSDAMDEAAPTRGLQVHRSHWVAEGAVAEARREGGRVRLTLLDGSSVPVSRGRMAALREAGWI